MIQEHLYIGIRKPGRSWQVRPIDELAEADLAGVDVAHDLQSTLVIGRDPESAARQVALQAAGEVDPFHALEHEGHDCCVLTLLRERVRRASPRRPPQGA